MLKIRQADLNNEIYAGTPIYSDDCLEIPPHSGRIFFREPLICRDLRIGEGSHLHIRGGARIRMLTSSGSLAVSGNSWIGAVIQTGDLFVDGDLAIWLGDLVIHQGDACISGDIRASGRIFLREGFLIASGKIEAASAISSPLIWVGSSGDPFPKRAQISAMKAEKSIGLIEAKTGKA